MSTGTDIIQRALQKIGAHSTVSPANPESIVLGWETLLSMLEGWLSEGVEIGYTPIEAPGDELNEPVDTRNAIIANLAVNLAPDFDNGKVIVSPALASAARKGAKKVFGLYQTFTIPKKVVSGTLPVGAGNSRGMYRRVFFGGGATLSDEN